MTHTWSTFRRLRDPRSYINQTIPSRWRSAKLSHRARILSSGRMPSVSEFNAINEIEKKIIFTTKVSAVKRLTL